MRQNRVASTPGRTMFVSTCRVEADQKDIIIDKLKVEAEVLRKNSCQFQMLRQQYSDLDRKYRAQLEEKNLQDVDFKNRHDGALRHIGQLRNEAEAIKAELRDKKLEIEDLKTDEEGLKNSLEQKNIDIQKFRTDINALICDSQQLESERRAFVSQAEGLRKNNSQLNEQHFNLQKENQACEAKLGDLQKYLEQLSTESQILKQKIKSYEDTNNDLDGQIQLTINELADMENTIYECQDNVAQLQNANASIEANVQQFKSQALHNQRATQAEVMKSNDLVKRLKQAEGALRVRKGQVDEGNAQMEALSAQNSNLQKVNTQFADDLQSCRKHLQNLRLLNHQLINSLQSFSQQDKRAAQLINREQRVKYLSGRVQQTSSADLHGVKDTARTDISFTTSRRLYHF